MKLKNFSGVGTSKVFLPPGPFLTLLDFLEQRFPKGTRSGWESRMLSGRVMDENGVVLMPDCPYQAGRYVYYYREVIENFSIPFEEELIYEDENILVADKPHFLPVTPVGPYIQETLLVRLRNKTGIEQLSAVHRLDLETSGLVLFTKKAEHRNLYASLFRNKQVYKSYIAIAPFTDRYTWPHEYTSRIESSSQFMKMQEVEGPMNSTTTIRMLDRYEGLALYELKPSTGKKHQLRVHMNALGIPICHDQIYPVMREYVPPEIRNYDNPLQLLAKKLEFTDPVTQQPKIFRSKRRLNWPNQDLIDQS